MIAVWIFNYMLTGSHDFFANETKYHGNRIRDLVADLNIDIILHHQYRDL